VVRGRECAGSGWGLAGEVVTHVNYFNSSFAFNTNVIYIMKVDIESNSL
jgi:hypothetical protein